MKTTPFAGKLVGISLAIGLLGWIVFSSGYFGAESSEEDSQTALTISNASNVMSNAFTQNDWSTVDAACRVLLNQDPFHAEARFNLGFSLYKQDRLDEATEHYLQSMDFPEYRDYSLFNLACIYARKDKVESAIESLQKALENGFASSTGLQNNQDLITLRDHPMFPQFVDMENLNRGTRNDVQGN